MTTGPNSDDFIDGKITCDEANADRLQEQLRIDDRFYIRSPWLGNPDMRLDRLRCGDQAKPELSA
jgi:hypothetical protein